MQNIPIDVIIPTYKPQKDFACVIERLQNQTIVPNKIILMNTQEELLTPFLEESRVLKRYDNIEIHHLKKEEFDHGLTRHMGVQHSRADFFLCMTQDALPAEKRMIEELLEALTDREVAAAYARQLPRPDCRILEKYTRSFNYPGESRIKSIQDTKELGIKTYFCSNVCAAYNRRIYDEVGGFIPRAIFNEDMIYAARVMEKGYRVAYTATARVVHSHNYTGKQQFQRNFDLGVSQADYPDIFEHVPSENEGKKMVREMLGILWKKRKPLEIINFIYQSGCKFLGYRMGKAYKRLPRFLTKAFSMNKSYWRF